jgi:peptidoglycan hydrolase FlgJ
MTAIPLTAISGTDNNPELLQSLKKGGKQYAGEARKAEIRKVAVEFQSLFVEMMLKSMRETVNKDTLTGGGHGDEVYGSMLDREYATAISRRGNIGLAEMIEQQMLAQEFGNEKAIKGAHGTGKTDKSNIEASHEN